MSELPPPAWVHWPIRVLAVIFVLPFRVLWELLRHAGRFLARYVGRPLVWLWHYAVAVPLAFLWRYLIAVPASWLWEQALRPALGWLWRHRRFLVRPFAMFVHYLVVVPVGWLWAVTAPMWRALARGVTVVLLAGWHGAGWVLRQVHRWLLRPAGLAVAWCWRHTVVPAYRMVAAGGRWVREAVLQPAASTARAVLGSVGLRR